MERAEIKGSTDQGHARFERKVRVRYMGRSIGSHALATPKLSNTAATSVALCMRMKGSRGHGLTLPEQRALDHVLAPRLEAVEGLAAFARVLCILRLLEAVGGGQLALRRDLRHIGGSG
jgi:hypothetical protein